MLKRLYSLLLGISFMCSAAFPVSSAALKPRIHEPIRPLQAIAVDAEKVALGDRLFHETRLSLDNSISCAHCHNLDTGGADALPHSFGMKGVEGEMNSPTVFNATLNLAQFWDGRAKTLEAQIDGPLHAKAEMASNWPNVVSKLEADRSYQMAFDRVYNGDINEQNIKNAIAEFERSLITVGSRFDQYLEGDNNAINDKEKKGYKLFKGLGCVACHQGENVGGNLFQTLGIMEDYFATYTQIKTRDLGRFNVTGRIEDKHKFKVPSLRLVTLTAPYLHDGSKEKLEDVVRTMARYQLGIKISDADVTSIISFLGTLVGKHPKLAVVQ